MHFPMPCCPSMRGQNDMSTIGVTRRASAKLPHHRRHVLTYPMENEMPLVHHVVGWHGCNCTSEDDESLNERTQGHPMTKSKSKLMYARCEQGKILN
jgi:hypothetical protein